MSTGAVAVAAQAGEAITTAALAVTATRASRWFRIDASQERGAGIRCPRRARPSYTRRGGGKVRGAAPCAVLRPVRTVRRRPTTQQRRE